MKNSYKKPFRLKSQKDIVFLLRQGARWKSDIFTVIYHPNSLEQDRFNVLISKKNGGAVERVRIKRIYREAYITTEVGAGQYYDILIRPFYNVEHTFHKVQELYGYWRTEVLS